MIDIDAPLDLTDPRAAAFLGAIQGNIVKGHGRDFTAHILLKMRGAVPEVRSWITGFADTHVTTAASARRQTAVWHQTAAADPGEPFAMFLLSPDGFRYLGFSDAELPQPSRHVAPHASHAEYFRRGMKGQASVPGRRYNDPPVERWAAPFQGTIDAMVLLADDDPQRLQTSIDTVVASLAKLFEVVTIEHGAALRATFPRGELVIEHFGFQDGVSQPIMIVQDAADEIAARGNTRWNPTAPLNLALVEHAGGYGSFMVFRKLEQDVKAFRDQLAALANATGLTPERAGAMAVGRFEDGTPIIPTAVLQQGADANDFHFDQDPDGLVCPFHAHIRKTNPRGDIPDEALERSRRIVRRGITYGARPDLLSGGTPPEAGVGLLFMCFQSNLDQFVIQQEGADSNDFFPGNVGVDAVIGQNQAPLAQSWPAGGPQFTMANMVRMLGGEYFFAPAMGFLRNAVPGGATP